MSHRIAIAALVCIVLSFVPALAGDEGSSLVRVRVKGSFPENQSDANVPINLGPDTVKLDNKVNGELNFVHFFTDRFSGELALPLSDEQSVRSGGTKLGSFDIWSPTLTLQYRFTDTTDFQPYVGAGLNYAKISGINLNGLPGLDMASSHSGLALQLGFDAKMGDRTYWNVDLRKLYQSVDIVQFGSKYTTMQMNPLVISVGIGWRL